VGVEIKLRARWQRDRRSIAGRNKTFFSSPQCLDLLWRSPSILSKWYRGYFPGNNVAGALNWPLSGVEVETRVICEKKNPPWLWSASELCRPSDRRLLAKSCQLLRIEGVAWSAQRIPPIVSLGFLDGSRYLFFQVAPQLSSRGWVDPVPDPLLLGKSGSAGNLTQDLWICSQKLWPLDHRGGRNLWKGNWNAQETRKILGYRRLWF
jgi:hypothetical protein